MTPEELAEQRNAKRRSRAAALRQHKKAVLAEASGEGNHASANANTAPGAGAVSSDGNMLVANAAPENGHESMGVTDMNGAVVYLASNDHKHEHVHEQMHVMPEVVPGFRTRPISNIMMVSA